MSFPVLNRARGVLARYGWRTPVVVLLLSNARWIRLRERFSVALLRCCTEGSKSHRVAIGRNVSVTAGGFLSLGEGCYIGHRCIFEIGVSPEAKISIGPSTWISHDCHVHSLLRIDIGRDVLIGEFVSIRDTTHTYALEDQPIKGQPDVSSPIAIEDGVWIGRGCLLQSKHSGLRVGYGAIIGANSVVTKSIPPMEIWAGAPARFISRRDAATSATNTEGAERSNSPSAVIA